MSTAHTWAQPLSLHEVGDLTAQWLEGRGWAPWNTGAPPDLETTDLVPFLAKMNRSGFVTEFSQPGTREGHTAQRATVEGFCDRKQQGGSHRCRSRPNS